MDTFVVKVEKRIHSKRSVESVDDEHYQTMRKRQDLAGEKVQKRDIIPYYMKNHLFKDQSEKGADVGEWMGEEGDVRTEALFEDRLEYISTVKPEKDEKFSKDRKPDIKLGNNWQANDYTECPQREDVGVRRDQIDQSKQSSSLQLEKKEKTPSKGKGPYSQLKKMDEKDEDGERKKKNDRETGGRSLPDGEEHRTVTSEVERYYDYLSRKRYCISDKNKDNGFEGHHRNFRSLDGSSSSNFVDSSSSNSSGKSRSSLDNSNSPSETLNRSSVSSNSSSDNLLHSLEDSNMPDEVALQTKSLGLRVIQSENLHCDYYTKFFSQKEADEIFKECENTLTYFEGNLAKVRVFGRWHDVPRKQVTHGDHGLTYTYSGITTPARPWTPLLLRIRDKIEKVTKHSYNFVLINRYQDGKDGIGEHQDDEPELDPYSPIASLTIGDEREFVLRHADARGSDPRRTEIEPISIKLNHGSLLAMNPPTNYYWFHSLPKCFESHGIRINMTFRTIVRHRCKQWKWD